MKRHAGFTIIELLVAIVIMMLLVAAASIGFNRARISSRDARRLSDVVAIAKAIDSSAAAKALYPKLSTGKKTDCADRIESTSLDLSFFSDRKIPVDPTPATKSSTGACTSFLDGYTYHTYASKSATNYAEANSLRYALEVGFEKNKFSDEKTLKENGGEKESRTPYVLPGTYCGSTCL